MTALFHLWMWVRSYIGCLKELGVIRDSSRNWRSGNMEVSLRQVIVYFLRSQYFFLRNTASRAPMVRRRANRVLLDHIECYTRTFLSYPPFKSFGVLLCSLYIREFTHRPVQDETCYNSYRRVRFVVGVSHDVSISPQLPCFLDFRASLAAPFRLHVLFHLPLELDLYNIPHILSPKKE